MTSIPSVFDLFETTARRWPGRDFVFVTRHTAQQLGIAAGPLTYGEALSRVLARAEAYRQAGWGLGHRVGVLLENRPSFLIEWLALNAVGAAIVPFNPHLKRGEIAYQVAKAEVSLGVALPERHQDLRHAVSDMAIVSPEDAVPVAPNQQVADDPDDPVSAILFTSGTTGRPKGCLLSNAYFGFVGDWYRSVGGHLTIREDPAERLVTPLPLFHVNALAFSVMGMISVGGCLTLLDRFHPKTWWQEVHEAEATIIHYLGIMPALLLTETPGPFERDHAVRFGFGAGIGLPLHASAEARFGFPFVEGWAMTETGAGGVIMATEEPRSPGTGSFGRARAGVEAHVIRDDGSPAAPDEPGELLVRRSGPDPRLGFFRGYVNDPEATEEAWATGWLATGDVVTRSADGDFRFVDRKKNVIRRSGENISAVEVETLMMAHPSIRSIAIAPVPDEIRGEEVGALIVADDPTPALARELTVWALEQMAYYKVPGWVAFVDWLPLTATEKLQRGMIRKLARESVHDGAAHDVRALKRHRR